MDIQVQLEDLSTVKKKLKVEIPAETALRETNRVANEYRKHARLPGFRPGKAPLELVKRRFQKDIRQDVLQKLIPESYDQAIKEQDLRPLGRPSLENMDFEEGKPIVYEARLEVGPKVSVPPYKGLEVSAEEPTVSEEDIDQEIDKLREKHAHLVSVEGRTVRDGDYAAVDLRGEYVDQSAEGRRKERSQVAPIEEENVLLKVGDESTLQAFNEALLGMSVGEEKTCQVEYPPKYPTEKLAGRKVLFQLRLNEIKKKDLPEANDEFAKDLGDYTTLAQLRERVRADLKELREKNRETALKNKLIDKLVEGESFEIPDLMVEGRLDEKVRDLAYNIAAQGVDPSKANVDWMKLRVQLRPEAEKEVRARVVLGEIANQEHLEVASEDLERELDRMANSVNQPKEKLRQQLEKDNRMEELRGEILRREALSLVFQNAKVK